MSLPDAGVFHPSVSYLREKPKFPPLPFGFFGAL
jgi:hypothetical protein